MRELNAQSPRHKIEEVQYHNMWGLTHILLRALFHQSECNLFCCEFDYSSRIISIKSGVAGLSHRFLYLNQPPTILKCVQGQLTPIFVLSTQVIRMLPPNYF